MLIGLKSNNYYSKVFKIVNYKLWNSTFLSSNQQPSDGLLLWSPRDAGHGMTWSRSFYGGFRLILTYMYRGESLRLWDRGQRSPFHRSCPVGVGRLPRSLIDHQIGIRYRWFWGVYSLELPDTWSGYHSWILDLRFWLCMMLRMVFPDFYGLILPLVMSRGRNLSEERDQLMWVLSILPIRGLLGVIFQFHSFPRLILLMCLISIGHEHLVRLMIKLTCLKH